MKSLIIMLPKIWKMEETVVGADLGLGRFQFDFDQEEDIVEVLRMQPYHFDYWMISLVRWQPVREKNYSSEITFWVRVLGVPIEFWASQTFESIGAAVGKVEEVDVDFGRVKVVLDGSQPLSFDVSIDFKGGEFHGGEEASVTLKYEKLFGFCKTCFSLCHDYHHCPLTMECPRDERDTREGSPELKNERSASYKGVVINGGEGNMGFDRKEHQGKGKGKMYEEDDTKWVKVPEKESRKSVSIRDRVRREDRVRRDDMEVQFRSSRQTLPRTTDYGDRQRFSGARGRRRERSPRDYFRHQERRKETQLDSTRAEEALVPRRTQQEIPKRESGEVILAKVHASESSKAGVQERTWRRVWTWLMRCLKTRI